MRGRGTGAWRAPVWIGAFAVTTWLLIDAFTGGSIPLAVVALSLAAGAATAATAIVAALLGSGPGAASGAGRWRPAGRVVAGVAGALAGLCAAIVANLFTWAAFTGCFIHCDDADRSPLAGVAFGAVGVASAVGGGLCLAWGLQAERRTRLAIAGVAGMAEAVLVLTTVAAS